jgi:hypothetical protein
MMKKFFPKNQETTSYFLIENLDSYEALRMRASILDSNKIPWYFPGDNLSAIIIPTHIFLEKVFELINNNLTITSGLFNLILRKNKIWELFVDEEEGIGYRKITPFKLRGHHTVINGIELHSDEPPITYDFARKDATCSIIELCGKPEKRNKDGYVIESSKPHIEFCLLDHPSYKKYPLHKIMDGNFRASLDNNEYYHAISDLYFRLDSLISGPTPYATENLFYSIHYLRVLFNLRNKIDYLISFIEEILFNKTRQFAYAQMDQPREGFFLEYDKIYKECPVNLI